MTLHLIETNEFSAVGRGNLSRAALFLGSALSSIPVRLIRSVASEIVSMFRDDLDHGRIRRNPKDWER